MLHQTSLHIASLEQCYICNFHLPNNFILMIDVVGFVKQPLFILFQCFEVIQLLIV